MQVNEFNGNRWRGAILMRGYRRRGTSAAAAFSTIIHFECNIVRDMSTRSLLEQERSSSLCSVASSPSPPPLPPPSLPLRLHFDSYIIPRQLAQYAGSQNRNDNTLVDHLSTTTPTTPANVSTRSVLHFFGALWLPFPSPSSSSSSSFIFPFSRLYTLTWRIWSSASTEILGFSQHRRRSVRSRSELTRVEPVGIATKPNSRKWIVIFVDKRKPLSTINLSQWSLLITIRSFVSR